jgi:hypothetical protein
VVNHGALHFTFGMRGAYLSVPLALGLFGPTWKQKMISLKSDN